MGVNFVEDREIGREMEAGRRVQFMVQSKLGEIRDSESKVIAIKKKKKSQVTEVE